MKNNNTTALFAKLAAKVFVLALLFGLTACGGNFVKGGMPPLNGNEKVGILIARQHVLKSAGLKDVMVSEKVNKIAADKISENISAQLAKQGFTPVIIPAEKVPELVKVYMAAPRYPHHTIDNPEAMALDGISATFKEYGIDSLLIFEADSTIKASAISSFTGAATAASIGLLTGTLTGSGSGRPNSITYTSILEPNGKLSYYNREQFTKTGDITSPLDRDIMAETIVKRWAKAR